MPIDLRKEIKLSDLFKGREKDAATPAPVAPPPPPDAKRKRDADPPLPQVPLMRGFNLMPREDAGKAKGRRATAHVALALVAVVAVGALGSLFVLSSAGVTEKEAKRDELRMELAALEVPSKAPAEEQAPELASEQQNRTAELARALGARVAWDRLLRDFALVLPDDVWLTNLVAKGAPRDPAAATPAPDGSAEGNSFTITGYTREQEGVARLLARLSVLPELSNVALVSSARVEVEDEEVVQFSVSATVKQPEGTA
jgi:Tfp pilus assembly protein PilN